MLPIKLPLKDTVLFCFVSNNFFISFCHLFTTSCKFYLLITQKLNIIMFWPKLFYTCSFSVHSLTSSKWELRFFFQIPFFFQLKLVCKSANVHALQGYDVTTIPPTTENPKTLITDHWALLVQSSYSLVIFILWSSLLRLFPIPQFCFFIYHMNVIIELVCLSTLT